MAIGQFCTISTPAKVVKSPFLPHLFYRYFSSKAKKKIKWCSITQKCRFKTYKFKSNVVWADVCSTGRQRVRANFKPFVAREQRFFCLRTIPITSYMSARKPDWRSRPGIEPSIYCLLQRFKALHPRTTTEVKEYEEETASKNQNSTFGWGIPQPLGIPKI